MIDLHIHTLASDGQYSAREAVDLCARMGIYAMAIADHNTVESVPGGEAAARQAGIKFAPCVELDTVFRDRDLHILGYFIEYGSKACADYMAEIFREKMNQTRMRVGKLVEHGFDLDFEELIKESAGRLPTGKQYIGAMKKREANLQNPDFMAYIDGPRSGSPFLNFYLDWLKAGRPAFVPLSVQPSERAVQKIKELGGVPVLAHPSDTPDDDVHALVDAGLMGLEVYSSYHDEALTEKFLAIAKDRGVLVTAGSDFHGEAVKPEVSLAGIPGNEDRLFEELKEAAGL